MSIRPDVRTVTNVVALLVSGTLAGVIVAAAALPAVGFSGLAAKSATDSFQNLPSELRTVPLPQTSRLFASDGTLITSFYDENREITQLKDVPAVMREAMIAAEDSRFYQHKGVDMQGVVRAFIANQQAGEITQGASTLTQQYVKNILKYRAKTERERKAAEAQNHARKLREMRLAMAVEKKYTKDEILERYLNIAFFGNGGYGIGAAAKVYFSKSASKLTLAESALLAGMVRSPSETNPFASGKAKAEALQRRNYILQRMVDLEYISKAEAAEAKKQPITLKGSQAPASCNAAVGSYGFYCDWFLSWWKKQAVFGKTPSQRLDNLKKGGYQIYAAVDPRVQSAAQAAVNSQLDATDQFATGTAVIEPGTGYVKALAINRIFGQGKGKNKNVGKNRPYTENPLLTGSNKSWGFQAGSTNKMFTMVAALQQGIPLNITIDSPHQYRTSVRESGPASCDGGWYCPKNAAKLMAGVHTMYSGFGESVNTFFIQLEEMAGVKASVEAAQKLGIVFRAPGDSPGQNEGDMLKKNGSLAFTLGTAQVTPLDMANSYATIAARGKRCDPLPVIKILDRDGKPVTAPAEPKCQQTIPADVADAAADAARCPVGDASRSKCARKNGITASRVGSNIDRPVAGKSGTTDDNRAAWFVGFTPNLAASAFITNPDAPLMSIGGEERHKIPVTIFNKVMQAALEKLPVKQFVAPTALRVYGIPVEVPDVHGMDQDKAIRRLKSVGFDARVTDHIPSNEPAGKVAKTSPAGKSMASKGSVVAIFVSNGKPDPKDPARPGQPGVPPPRRHGLLPPAIIPLGG